VDKLPAVAVVGVTPGYFDAAGMRRIAGRDITDGDAAHSERVALISAALAARHFGVRNPLGRSVQVQIDGDDFATVSVVGVVADAKYTDLRETPGPVIYLPLAQLPGPQHGVQLAIRTAGPPAVAAHAAMVAIDAAAPGVIVRRVQEMRSAKAVATTVERLSARLATAVSVMALLLSAIGVYGVVAYSVSMRTSEIGVRRALGAGTPSLLWLVAKEALLLVLFGVAVGVPCSFAIDRALRAQLFGVATYNLFATGVAVLLLACAGVAASVIPARRAARVHPRTALIAD
jgi:ABC-type lipoprotein release transport system permease subunit